MSDDAALDLGATVQRSPDTVDATIDEELVTLDVESGKYFVMDAIASRIWELIAEPITVESLCGRLTAEYDVDADQCRQDVLAFLNELFAQRVVRRIA